MRTLRWAGLLVGTLALLALAFLGYLDRRDQNMAIFSGPRESGPGFRIGILGDSQKGLANLRNITAAVLREKPGLLLHTGDLVSNNDDGHYRLAVRYLTRGGAARMPHVTPGNHDLKGGSERFMQWCGPLEQTFAVGGVAVALLDNAHGIPPDPRHVEERIAAAPPHRAVLLAMHQPPFDVDGAARPEYAAFLAWLEKSKVDYLLCGHVHGYIKKKVGDTTVIINGVGGDYDSWQLDQKVYATILEVDGSKISDRRIEIEPAHEIWENIEHAAIGHVAESYRQKPVLCWVGTLLLIAGTAWGWVTLLRRDVTY
ncbi:MAG TPA: metallophosphoesterase [Planctomycetota bacterium]|jgi:3',5'-cyclic AMP phosphodiesterase CpdA|nr:metallophosphoesterase [Planctomycetota bacterium]